MKKYMLLILMSICVITTMPYPISAATVSDFGLMASAKKITSAEKETLKSKLRSKGTIYDAVYRDFDNDGKYEAVIGLRTKNSTYNGVNQGDKAIDSLWYVDNNKIKKISSGVLFFNNSLNASKVKNGYIITYQCDLDAVNASSYQWFINSSGHFKKLPEIMGFLTYKGNNKFYVNLEEWDATDIGGITWKRYDLFWNGKQLCEYGSWIIPEGAFQRYDGGETILKKIKKEYPDGWINDIYQRENGVININFSVTDYSESVIHSEYYNITVKLKENKVSYYEDYQIKNPYAKNSFQKALYYGSYAGSTDIKGIKMVFANQSTVNIPDPVFVDSDIADDYNAKYGYTPLVAFSGEQWPVIYSIGYESNGDNKYYHLDGDVVGKDDNYVYIKTTIYQDAHIEKKLLRSLQMKLGDIAIFDGNKYIVSSVDKNDIPYSLSSMNGSFPIFFGEDIKPDEYCNVSSYMGAEGSTEKKLTVRMCREAMVHICTFDGKTYDTTADKFFTEWNKKDKKAENYQHASGYRWDVLEVDKTGSISEFSVVAAD